MKKLFLLDAFALIYRAHFAFSKNPRINSKGLNTGAILGFANTIFDVLEKQKPTHIGIAFDTPEPTFRHETYEAYKAQREAQPEDITLSIPYIFRLLEALKIPILKKPGFEADDVVGTLAKKAAKEGFEVFMMTSDKDYSQLVSENIWLYKPAYLGNDVAIWGVKEVLEKWEINRVEQVTDILGLQGDAVDNIPGIPGVGEKTAKKLIQEYDTVENLIANAAQIKGKLGQNLKEFAQQGLLSKQLATIDTNVPIDFDAESLLYEAFDEPALRNLFNELEFRTLGKKLFKENTPEEKNKTKTKTDPKNQIGLFGEANQNTNANTEQEKPTSDENAENTTIFYHNALTLPHRYHLLEEESEIKRLVNIIMTLPHFCYDTETTSIDAYRAEIVGMSIAWVPQEAYYIPFPPEKEETQKRLEWLRPIFENENIEIIGQNLKYDNAILENYGIKVKAKLFDTMLAHYLLEPDNRHDLDTLAKNYLGYEMIPIENLIGKKGKDQKSMREVDLSEIVEYAAEDADKTYQLYHYFAPLVQKQNLGKLLYEIETPLINVLSSMERTGIRINTQNLKEISNTLTQEIALLEKEIYQQAGEKFNVASPKQLGEILFDKLKLDEKAKKTKTGQYATGEEVLIKLADKHIIISQILEYRELQKLKNTYVDALPNLLNATTGKIHTSYNQAVAATGRLSSINPNLQNIPIKTAKGREIRKAFVPTNENYKLISADYSQIELRIMAEFSQDATMLEAFQQKQDIHTATAAKIFKVGLSEVSSEMRRKAKTANFGIIYGISAHGLSQRLNIPRKEASEIIQAYFEQFPAIKQYMDKVIQQARENEYVTTLLGRRRYLRNINARNAVERGIAERTAINAPIQGSAADMIKLAMINIHQAMRKEGMKSQMILQVHDELVFDAHLDEIATLSELIRTLMTEAMPLSVPIEVEIGVGDNWLEAH
ncbi:MAG: DNA polymerase I [Cytophagales bacterium]|nr:MAG: DNA polymerase I [Cytophagales bacterium]